MLRMSYCVGEARVRVDVALADAELALVVLGQRFDVGGDGAAGGAPGGPEVHEHRDLRVQDLGFEVGVGHLDHVLAGHADPLARPRGRVQVGVVGARGGPDPRGPW